MRRLALVLFVLFVIAIAACGGDGDGTGDDPIAVLSAAPDATVESNTARFAMRMEAEGSIPLDIVAEGVMDFAERISSARMDMTDMLRRAGAPSGLDGRVEMMMQGATIYMRSPMFAAMGMSTIDEDTWIRMDLQAIGEQQGIDFNQLMNGVGNDPRQGLAMLQGVAGEVEEVGDEEIRGADTTHYRATVNLEKAMAQTGGFVDEEAFRAFIDQFQSTDLDVDAWIDEEGRVRKMAMDFPPPAQAAGQIESMRMTMEFFDFGTDVHIEVPAESIDFVELMEGAGVGMTGGEMGY